MKILMGLLLGLMMQPSMAYMFNDTDRIQEIWEKRRLLAVEFEKAEKMLTVANLSEFRIARYQRESLSANIIVYATDGRGGVCLIDTQLIQTQQVCSASSDCENEKYDIAPGFSLAIKCFNEESGILIFEHLL